MAAVFTYAAVYHITAACLAPLRVGGSDGDTEKVLCDAAGRPFLPGTSLAGALRAWLEQNAPAKTMALFGGEESRLKKAGHLIVSDAFFAGDAPLELRPRLRIDPRTGTAAAGAKFDLAHIGKGAELSFMLTWLGDKEDIDELAVVEDMLAALHTGDIVLGAHKTNGFGRVALEVTRQTFDMFDPADRQKWLSDQYQGERLTLPEDRPGNMVKFTLTGRADDLLVRSGKTMEVEKKSYTVNITEKGVPVIPATSLRGAVRAQASRIVRAAGIDPAAIDELFGCAADGGRPGRVRFEDAVLTKAQKKMITRIRIDKFTGGVMRRALINEEPISSPLTLRLQAPNEPLACALLLYALRDLGLGLYSLGGESAVGRGYVKVDEIKAAAPDGRVMRLRFAGDAITLDDPDNLADEWLKAWGREQA